MEENLTSVIDILKKDIFFMPEKLAMSLVFDVPQKRLSRIVSSIDCSVTIAISVHDFKPSSSLCPSHTSGPSDSSRNHSVASGAFTNTLRPVF